MNKKNKIQEQIISLIVFSSLVMVCMIIIPMIIIKPSSVKAIENAQENKDGDSENNKYIELKSDNTVKVYISKEDKIKDIPLEEYVASVVSGEMPATFSDEALKAQAVAARTYVAAKKGRHCPKAKDGEVCDTTHCQVFMDKEARIKSWGEKGNEYWTKIENAINSTKAMVMSYDNQLVEYPQFFSTSSGKTENAVDVFSNDIPYLVSTESKGEEGVAPKYKSSISIKIDEFVKNINDKYPNAKVKADNLSKNIEVISRSDAGGIKEIKVGNEKIKGTDFRTLLKLNSTNFEYSIKESEIVFDCKGYGHGVGMSQWGANVMGKEGLSYDKILKHYYTGVEIKELKFIK